MKKIIFLTAFVFVFSLFEAAGQQIPMYSSYNMNEFLLNPAATGKLEQTNVFGIFRDQFSGIDGAPVTYVVSADGFIKKKNIGVGLKVFNDQTDIINTSGFEMAYSYKIRLTEKIGARFGLGATVSQFNVDFDRAVAFDPNEPLLYSDEFSKIIFDADAGLLLNYNKFELGFAVPQALGTRVSYKNEEGSRTAYFQQIRHLMISGRYPFSLNENLELEPMVLFRGAKNISPQMDLNLLLRWNEKGYVSTAYRHGYAVSAGFGVNVSERVMIGYSFDRPVNEIRRITSGSHEIVLRLTFAKNKEKSQILNGNSEKELQLEGRVRELIEINEVQAEEIRKFRELLKENDAELDSLKKIYDQEPYSGLEKEDQDMNSTEQPVQEEVIPEKTPAPSDPDKIYNVQDIKGKFLVVLGSFHSLENARDYQKVLIRAGRTQKTTIARSEDGRWFFVFEKGFDTIEEARKERSLIPMDNLDELMIPWIFKIK